jgi:hypothetical protein
MSDTLTYFAQLDDQNVVVHVAVVTAEFMAANPDRYPGRWVETYRDRPGKTYAGVGYTYDPLTDDFTAPPAPTSGEPQ